MSEPTSTPEKPTFAAVMRPCARGGLWVLVALFWLLRSLLSPAAKAALDAEEWCLEQIEKLT